VDPRRAGADLVRRRPQQTLIVDNHYHGHDLETDVAGGGLRVPRPARRGEPEHDDQRFFTPLRQVIESVSDTDERRFGLARHGGRTQAEVMVRALQWLVTQSVAGGTKTDSATIQRS
jgi:hypothetical protein